MSKIYSCALCVAYIPNVVANVISIDFDEASKDGQKSSTTNTIVVFEWQFEKEFNQTIFHTYDTNTNGVIEPNEMAQIKQSLTNYILPREQLTKALIKQGDKLERAKFTLQSDEMFIRDTLLTYRYKISIPLQDSNTFSFQINDNEGFFNFTFSQHKKTFILNQKSWVSNTIDNVIIFREKETRELESKNVDSTQNPNKQNLVNDFAKQSQQTFWQNLRSDLWQKIATLNAKILSIIKSYIYDEQGKTSFFGILSLVAISFGYGVFHAAAPGHAKLLTSSYFLSHKGSYSKAFSFALKVGVVHILSAFLLVGLGLFVLKVVVQSLANEANIIITQVSSVIIMLLACILLVGKIRHSSACECKTCSLSKGATKTLNQAKRFDFAQWSVIIAAGIVPCPTMIIVLLLCFEAGFFSTLLSAICIAIGMSAVVFISAIFAHKVRLSTTSQSISRTLEYFALICMLCLGIFMFANASAL